MLQSKTSKISIKHELQAKRGFDIEGTMSSIFLTYLIYSKQNAIKALVIATPD
jgi:hypothetical protein